MAKHDSDRLEASQVIILTIYMSIYYVYMYTRRAYYDNWLTERQIILYIYIGMRIYI